MGGCKVKKVKITRSGRDMRCEKRCCVGCGEWGGSVDMGCKKVRCADNHSWMKRHCDKKRAQKKNFSPVCSMNTAQSL